MTKVGVGVGRGRGDDDPLRPAGEVRRRGVALGEAPGRLDDDLDAELTPAQRRRVALGEDLDHVGVDDEVGALHLDRSRVAPVRRVVAEQVGVHLRAEKIVYRDDLDVRARFTATRRKLRPIRPNPLIPTRTVMSLLPLSKFRRRATWGRGGTVFVAEADSSDPGSPPWATVKGYLVRKPGGDTCRPHAGTRRFPSATGRRRGGGPREKSPGPAGGGRAPRRARLSGASRRYSRWRSTRMTSPPGEKGQEERDEVVDARQELDRLGRGHDVVGTSSSRPLCGRNASTQCGFGRNRAVEYEVGLSGRPFLKPNETIEVSSWPVVSRTANNSTRRARSSWTFVSDVSRTTSAPARSGSRSACLDRCQHALGLDGVTPAGAGEPPDKDLVGGLEVEDAHPGARSAQVLDRRDDLGDGLRPSPPTTKQNRSRSLPWSVASSATLLTKAGEVVDDEPAEVLERRGRGRLSRP